MNYLIWICIPVVLIGLSLLVHKKLIKSNPKFIKNKENINNFSFLANKAFRDFLKPQKTYLWALDLASLHEILKFSPEAFSVFLTHQKEEDFRRLWPDYDLILYWNKNERQKLSESYEILNPQLYHQEIERLNAQINHRIMEAFISNPQLLLEVENFLFYQSLNLKKVIK
jgi:hypothetical protein